MTADRISDCAQRLADERGLDGFTMEDLADAVGVARRTLFNHVPGKLDAVLGPEVASLPEPIVAFQNGGPTGELVPDIRKTGAAVLRIKDQDPEKLIRLRRLLDTDPRLLKFAHQRLERITGWLVEAIREREGDNITPLQARTLAFTTLSFFKIAVGEFIEDPSVPVAEHFLRVFDTAADLFG